MKAQLVRERKKLLTSIEKTLESPMIFLGFVWLGLLVIELIWGLSKSMEYVSLLIWIIFIFLRPSKMIDIDYYIIKITQRRKKFKSRVRNVFAKHFLEVYNEVKVTPQQLSRYTFLQLIFSLRKTNNFFTLHKQKKFSQVPFAYQSFLLFHNR